MLVEGSNRTLRKWHTCRIRSKLGSRGGNQRHVDMYEELKEVPALKEYWFFNALVNVI